MTKTPIAVLGIRTLSFSERCFQEAARLRAEAKSLQLGPERQALIKKTRQAETAVQMDLTMLNLRAAFDALVNVGSAKDRQRLRLHGPVKLESSGQRGLRRIYAKSRRGGSHCLVQLQTKRPKKGSYRANVVRSLTARWSGPLEPDRIKVLI